MPGSSVSKSTSNWTSSQLASWKVAGEAADDRQALLGLCYPHERPRLNYSVCRFHCGPTLAVLGFFVFLFFKMKLKWSKTCLKVILSPALWHRLSCKPSIYSTCMPVRVQHAPLSTLQSDSASGWHAWKSSGRWYQHLGCCIPMRNTNGLPDS